MAATEPDEKEIEVLQVKRRQSTWKKYKRNLIVSLAGMPLGGFCAIVTAVCAKHLNVGSVAYDGLVFIAASGWFLVVGINGLLATLFACPSCQKPFFCKLWYSNHFARRCVHCGFEKWGEVVVAPRIETKRSQNRDTGKL